MRVLIIDDDAGFVQDLQAALSEAGYETHGVTSGKEALRAAFKFQPHLILLDVMMPEMDGWETCRRLRDFYDGLIIFLSVRNAEADRINGLDIGADDYIAKPFSLPELLARLRARLRTTHAGSATERPTYVDARLVIDLERSRVVKDGRFLQFTPTEFDLLACLVRHAGEVLSHRQLLSEALGAEYARELNYLKVYVGRIRDKLEDDAHHPRYIVTHRGVGYAFAASAGHRE